MNDRFNFRAWHKEKKKMYIVNSICPYEDSSTKGGEVFLNSIEYASFYFPEEVKIMQCTGLKDKNGKLIYEGDVVKIFFKSLNQKITDVVEWDNTTARFKFAKFGQISIYNYTETWEVIGNIYQDSHLIENSNNLC